MNGKHGNSRTKSDKQHLYNNFHNAALGIIFKNSSLGSLLCPTTEIPVFPEMSLIHVTTILQR